MVGTRGVAPRLGLVCCDGGGHSLWEGVFVVECTWTMWRVGAQARSARCVPGPNELQRASGRTTARLAHREPLVLLWGCLLPWGSQRAPPATRAF